MPKGIYKRIEGINGKGWFKKRHKFIKGGEKGWFKKGRISERKGTGKKTNCLICKKEISFGSKNVKRKFCSRKCYAKNMTGKERIFNVCKGENHPNWKGGISKLKRYRHFEDKQIKKWRLNIFTRDNFTCQNCGERGCLLNAHHLKSWANYPELRYKIDNGVSLCKDCHKLIHKLKL